MQTFVAYVIKFVSTPDTSALVFMVLEKRNIKSAENGSCFSSMHNIRTDVLRVLLCQTARMVHFHPLFNFSITKLSGKAFN